MKTNLDVYRRDLEQLISQGELLELSIHFECFPDQKADLSGENEKNAMLMKELPRFNATYQTWYSEAIVLLRQLLPDRVSDFTRHYEKPKSRKQITYENYHIEDYLQGVQVKRSGEIVVEQSAAIPHFEQQLAIIKAARRRFESKLFDIRQLVQADLFDSELEAGKQLQDKGFLRAAGAIAGVVLEKHLKQVCENHSITLRKKNVTISNCNEALKNGEVIDVPQWRQLQFLMDIRNLCDHSRDSPPSKDQIEDLLKGVAKVIKTIF